jgi:hypothetical protein
MCTYCFGFDVDYVDKRLEAPECSCISSATFIGNMSNKPQEIPRNIYCHACHHEIHNVGANMDPKYGDWPSSCAAAMENALLIGQAKQREQLKEHPKILKR